LIFQNANQPYSKWWSHLKYHERKIICCRRAILVNLGVKIWKNVRTNYDGRTITTNLIWFWYRNGNLDSRSTRCCSGRIECRCFSWKSRTHT
jgi:hypothetical protein